MWIKKSKRLPVKWSLNFQISFQNCLNWSEFGCRIRGLLLCCNSYSLIWVMVQMHSTNCKMIPLQSVSISNAIMLSSKLLFPSTSHYRLKSSIFNQFQSIENSHQHVNCNHSLLFYQSQVPPLHKSPAQWDYNIKRHFNCHWNIICSVCTSTFLIPLHPNSWRNNRKLN